jgi:hypothetical protein
VVHWFNPVVWLAARAARTDTELACDETVLRHSGEGARVPYGETLLLLMQQLTWRRSALPAAGILEDRAAMRARVANIGSYAVPSRWRVLAAAVLLLAVSAVFADEKSESSAEAVPPPVSAPSIAGHLNNDSKPPASPEESGVQQTPQTLVEIESQFIETTDTALRRLKPGSAGVSLIQKVLSDSGSETVLSAEDATEFHRAKRELRGRLDFLSAPRVTTRSGQHALIEIIREFRYATDWTRDKATGLWAPTAWETRNSGVTLEVEPVVSEDGSITLVTTPQVVQFLGWRDVDTGKTFPVKNAARLLDWSKLPGPLGDTTAGKLGKQRLLPVFSSRKVETKATLRPGEALLLGQLPESEEVYSLKSPASSRRLMVVISARVISPIGNPAPHAAGAHRAPTSQGGVDALLFGGGTSKAAAPSQAAPPAGAGAHPVGLVRPGDKPGFVRNPYAPEEGQIDVRGYPSGTEVKDPYTGKLFLVP